MQPIDVIQRVHLASARPQKEKIIFEAFTAQCTDFFEAVRMGADPFRVYGVKRVGQILTDDDGLAGSYSFSDFRRLCDRLHTRVLVGEAARASIHQAAERCHVATWNDLYRPILLKNLGPLVPLVETVLKRLGEAAEPFRIPIFAPQVATIMRTTTSPSGIRLIDYKIPGTRLIAVLDKFARFHTQTGAPYEGALDFEAALSALAAWLPGPLVVDGVLNSDGHYIIFDAIPFADFRTRLCTKTHRERRAILVALQQSGAFTETRSIRVLPQIEIDFDQPSADDVLAEFTAQALRDGYTALVLKKPESGYVGKKSSSWQVRKIAVTDLSFA
jgi:hypothetical protein